MSLQDGEVRKESTPSAQGVDPAARAAYLVRALVRSLAMRDWEDEPHPGPKIDERRAWVHEIVALGPVAVPFLANPCGSKDWATVRGVVVMLGHIGGAAAIGLLRTVHDSEQARLVPPVTLALALARASGPDERTEVRGWYETAGITPDQRLMQLWDEHVGPETDALDALFAARVAEIAAQRNATLDAVWLAIHRLDKPAPWLARKDFSLVTLTQKEIAYLDELYA